MLTGNLQFPGLINARGRIPENSRDITESNFSPMRSLGAVLIHKTPDQVSPRLIPGPRSRLSELAKISRLLVRFNHVVSFIVNVNHSIM